MSKNIVFISICLSSMFFFSCVTTGNSTRENISKEIDNEIDNENENQVSESDDIEVKEDVEGSPSTEIAEETHGLINIKERNVNGPLLLGATGDMNEATVEFAIMYNLYIPMSGIISEDHGYKRSEGTRWRVFSEKDGEVFFEKALLMEGDNGRSWWYFKVDGEGFNREYEFLLENDYSLLELRYIEDGKIKRYIPYADDNEICSFREINYSDYNAGKERIKTEFGSYNSDYIVIESDDTGESEEYWVARNVPGKFIQAIYKKEDISIFIASLIEVKKGYDTKMESY